MDEQILKLEEQVDQIEPLERKVNEDNLQEVCNLNLVVTGLEDDNNLRDQCLTIASEQMAIEPYKVNIIDVKKIWINEDLCAPRSKLAYQARLVVTAGLRKRTWTYLGKVFTLQDDNSRPRLVNRFEELPPLPMPTTSK